MAFKGVRFAHMSARNIFNAGPGMKVALFGVLLIPLMFAGFYLYAFFDPYATLDKLPVAIVNEDKGAVINDEERNVGQEVCDKLKDYDGGLGWVFVSDEEAHKGLEQGTYYMIATIPENFSERIASVETDDPEAATFLVDYDESENMLASQIGSTAWIKAKDKINKTIIEEYWQTVLGQVADSADEIMTASDGAQKLANGLSTAIHGNGTITKNLGVLADGSTQLGDGADKLATGMSKLQDGSTSLTGGMSKLEKGSTDLSSGLDKLSAGSGSLSSGLDQLKTGSTSLTDGLGTLKAGSTSLTDGMGTLKSGSSQISGGLNELNEKTGTLAESVDQLSTGASSVADGVTALKKGLAEAAAGSEQVAGGLKKAAAGSNQLVEATKGTGQYIDAAQEALASSSDPASAKALEALGAAQKYNNGAIAGAQSMEDSLGTLSAGASSLNSGIQDMDKKSADLEKGAKEVSGGLEQLNDSVPELTGAVSALSEGATELDAGVSKVSNGASSLQKGITSAANGADTLEAGITTASNGANTLDAGITSASQGADTLAAGTTSATKGANTLAAGINTAAQGATTLADKVPELTDGAQKLEKGSATLGSGLVTAKDGSQTLADSLKEGAEKSAMTQTEVDDKASVMDEPVDMEDAYYTKVPNYGTGFAPFFIPLGIWVGCLLAGFLFKPINTRIAMSGGNPFMVAFSGYIPLGIYAIAQAVIALLFVQFGLGATIHNVPLYYLVGILCSLVFMAIMQFLVAAFGFVGRFLAVFLLTLQLTSSAGTFPLQLIPDLFNVLNPWMPMTYAVEGLRQAMTGVNPAVAGWDIAILLVFGIIAFIATAAYAYRKRTVTMTDLYPLLDL